MDVEYFKERFKNTETDYLLQRRAHGSELNPNAHIAIENILTERGESFPPIPLKSIEVVIANDRKPNNGFKKFGGLIIFAVGLVLAKAFAHTMIGVAFGIAALIYYCVIWLKRQTLSEEDRKKADEEAKAAQDGLTELMKCSADGDIQRVQELIDYGENINTKTLSGSTALMYAARNGHKDIVELLIISGANVKTKTDKGSTASSIAKKNGHDEINKLLENSALHKTGK
jgi:hypothetical protein